MITVKLDCSTVSSRRFISWVNLPSNPFVPAEVFLERRIKGGDVPPASLHQWLQIEETKQKEPFE